MAPARSYQDEKMDRNACDAVLIESMRTDTETGMSLIDGFVGSDIGKCRNRRSGSFSANQCADRNTHRYPGTDSDTHADTFGNTCCYPRADSCPYAGTHGSADGRTCPGAGEHELWCCAL